MKYRAEIDGLRAFSVLSVVLFHSFPTVFTGGFIGVDVFFVISGYLITQIIFKELDQNAFSFASFYARRVRRIFPALIISMVVALAIGWLMLLPDEYRALGGHIIRAVLFVLNFRLAHEAHDYFNMGGEIKPMMHLWSLSVEEQFYIIWPFVLWFAWKRKFNLLIITLVVAFASLTWNIQFIHTKPFETFFWPTGRFWELLSGSILAWLMLYKQENLAKFKLYIDSFLVKILWLNKQNFNGIVIMNFMSFMGFLTLICSIFLLNKDLNYPGSWAIIPVSGALLIIATGSSAWFNRIFLMNRIVVWLGLISYPLYLWHWPALSLVRIINVNPSPQALIITNITSVILAWLTYRFIEQPIRFGKRKKLAIISLIVGIIFVSIPAYVVHKNWGIRARFSGNLFKIMDAIGDREYSKNLINRKLIYGGEYYSNLNGPASVVFLGDSHMEVYTSRVIDIARSMNTETIAFVISRGYAPIPNYLGKKNTFLDRFKKVLKENPIKTVVIGAAFNAYLINNTSPLSSIKNPVLLKKSFYKFCIELAKRYRVLVLIDVPINDHFSPRSMFVGLNKKRPFFITDLTPAKNRTFYHDKQQIALEKEMVQMFKGTSIETISQSEVICPNNVCNALSIDGRPKYRDSAHLRPWFVKKYMNVLDHVILKKNNHREF